MTTRPSDRLLFRLILAAALAAGCWFYHRGGWAQASRLAAIYAFCEPVSPDCGRFTIDRFIDPAAPEKNGDWAFCNGHYYSNKAPGSFLPGILLYLPLFPLLRGLFGYPFPEGVRVFAEILLNFVCSGLWAALGAAWFYRLLRRLACSQRRASLFSLAFAFAAPMTAYCTMMWGHPMAAACTVFALYALTVPGRRGAIRSGFWIGCAVLADYLCAVFLPVFPFLLGGRHDWKRCGWWLAGGMLPALFFGYYHWKCFGTPFTLATLWNNPQFLDPEAAAGVSRGFSLAVLFKLLVGTRFGWLVQMPVMLTPLLLLKRGARPILPVRWIAAALWCIGAALLVNASFNGWHGGATACARYLIPSVPFWVLLAAAVPYRSAASRGFLAAALAVSAVNMAAITMTMPLFFHFYDWQYLLQPPFLKKSWCYHPLRFFDRPPLASGLLLLAVLAPLLWRMARQLRLGALLRRALPWRLAIVPFSLAAGAFLAWVFAACAPYGEGDAALTAAALAADRADILPPANAFYPWLAGLLSHDPAIQLAIMGFAAALVLGWGLMRLAAQLGRPMAERIALAAALSPLLVFIFTFTGAGRFLLAGIALSIAAAFLPARPLPSPGRKWVVVVGIVFGAALWIAVLTAGRGTPTLSAQYRLARETAGLRRQTGYPVLNTIPFYENRRDIYDRLCELALENGDAIRYDVPPAASGVIVLEETAERRLTYRLELTPLTE